MRRFLRVAALACALGSAARAHAFVRSTSTPLQPDKGVCLWWKPRRIAYFVNMSGYTGPSCGIGNAASQLAQASFPAWMNASRSGETSPCTDFTFTYGGENTGTSVGFDLAPGVTNMNLVVYRTGSCADPSVAPAADACHATPGACAARFNCWDHSAALAANTLALTTVTFLADTGEILDADMELNGWNGDSGVPQDGTAGWYFTCGGPDLPICSSPPYGQSACNWIDVGNTVTHEVGHMIGLDHVCVSSYPPPYNACPSPASVMAPTAVLGETRKRVLSPDDTEAICTIYPAGAATRTCISSANGGSAKGGCGSGDAGIATFAAAILWYALRRRPQARG